MSDITDPLFDRVSNGQATNGQADPPEMITNAQLQQLTENALFFQRQFLNMFTDKRRNIEKECGYPDISELTCDRYRQLYDRDPVAARVVNLYPGETWQVCPWVYETENLDETTQFEQALEDVGRNLAGIGVYEGEEGNPLWEYLERADVLSGIGRYGVILLGVDDGEGLEEPLDLTPIEDLLAKKDQPEDKADTGGAIRNLDFAKKPKTKPEIPAKTPPKPLEEEGPTEAPPFEAKRKLLYLRVLDESMAPISAWVTDLTDARYGQPEFYTVTISGSNNQTAGIEGQGAILTETTTTKKVHWTRIIHLADGLQSSECLGTPRMQVVYNRLYDLHKLYGGSAEMYFQGAFPGLSFETHPQLGGDVKVDPVDMRKQIQAYMTGLQRYLSPPGMSVKSLAPQVVDPTPQIEGQLEAICILLGCPKRVFMGSERGELSSNQDIRAWYSRVKRRQNRYVTPKVIVPFITRLIQLGILPQPQQFTVSWPDVDSVTDVEKADIGLKRTQALVAYVSGDGNAAVHLFDYLVRFLGFKEDEAQAMVDSKMEQLDSEDNADDPLAAHLDEKAQEEADAAAKEAEMAQQQHEEGVRQFDESTKQAVDLAKIKTRGTAKK
jgi:uncharacterized protein